MADGKLDELGPMMGAIGKEASRIARSTPDGIYIYAEVEDGSVYAGIFKDNGTSIRYYDPNQKLLQMLVDAWELDEPAKRWLVMEYAVRGTQFDTHFTFPEEVANKDYFVERRRAALKKRYGTRPITYPPMPDSFRGL